VQSNMPERSPAPPVWHVFDSTGALRSRVHTSLMPSQIGSDFWLSVIEGADGAPQVAMFPLRKR
jgi:hypothetical protein